VNLDAEFWDAVHGVYLPSFYVALWLIAVASCTTIKKKELFFTALFITGMKWSSSYADLWDNPLNMMSFDVAWVALIYFNLPGLFGNKLLVLTALMVVVDFISYQFPEVFGIAHDFYLLNVLNILYVAQCGIITNSCVEYHKINRARGGEKREYKPFYASRACDVFGFEVGRTARHSP